MKNGARGEGHLEMAFATLQKTPCFYAGSFEVLAFRAFKALGPAHFFKRVLTGALGAKAFLEFKQGQFRLDHGKPPYLR